MEEGHGGGGGEKGKQRGASLALFVPRGSCEERAEIHQTRRSQHFGHSPGQWSTAPLQLDFLVCPGRQQARRALEDIFLPLPEEA